MLRAHAVRHLLKSTLITSGCAQYAADHVLGHAPRDPYEKQAILYPDVMRAEYAKASSRLNIFSKVENSLNGAKDPESQEAHIRELEEEVAKTKASNAKYLYSKDGTKNPCRRCTRSWNPSRNRSIRCSATRRIAPDAGRDAKTAFK